MKYKDIVYNIKDKYFLLCLCEHRAKTMFLELFKGIMADDKHMFCGR